MRARLINENLSASKWNKTLDILVDKYGYDAEVAYHVLQDFTIGEELDDLSCEEIAKYAMEFDQENYEDPDDDFDEDKMRVDLFDPQDDSERFRSRQPGETFDLDQDIYDRNEDSNVD